MTPTRAPPLPVYSAAFHCHDYFWPLSLSAAFCCLVLPLPFAITFQFQDAALRFAASHCHRSQLIISLSFRQPVAFFPRRYAVSLMHDFFHIFTPPRFRQLIFFSQLYFEPYATLSQIRLSAAPLIGHHFLSLWLLTPLLCHTLFSPTFFLRFLITLIFIFFSLFTFFITHMIFHC